MRFTIQVKFRRELFIYAVTVGKFSGINFVNSYSFQTVKNYPKGPNLEKIQDLEIFERA